MFGKVFGLLGCLGILSAPRACSLVNARASATYRWRDLTFECLTKNCRMDLGKERKAIHLVARPDRETLELELNMVKQAIPA